MTENLNQDASEFDNQLRKLRELDLALETLANQQKYNKFPTWFADVGPYSKSKYPKHMEFIRQSKSHHITGVVGANSTGKTTLGGYIAYCHASGKYPPGWEGHKYNQGPIKIWIASIETKQLRAVQWVLFGSALDPGTEIIPRADMLDDHGHLQVFTLPGIAHCYGLVYIRHYTNGKFDGYSSIEFKTYEQGWLQFQGSTIQYIWLDEDPVKDPKIYSECLARTRGPEGKEGRITVTFTPTSGWSTIYLSFMPDGKCPEHGTHPNNPDKYTQLIGWQDIPHLSENYKRSMMLEWARDDPQTILARSTGIAMMGAGMIYSVDEKFCVVPRREIPSYFKRAYGLDFASSVGKTAVVWMAVDPNTNVKYVYAEYKQTGVHDSIHVLNILSKGKTIPGVCDPHSGRRDGGELRADYYRSLGLHLINGASNPAAGIAMILNDLQNGCLKFMDDCIELLKEKRTYRWDLKIPGRPAEKQDDHLLDALRYLYSKFDIVAKSEDDEYNIEVNNNMSDNYIGRDPLTGY